MPQLDQHSLYELDILEHVEKTSRLSNRLVAAKLGVSIKLAHQILKRMVKKGLLHVKVIHKRRWDYFLTPRGIARKSRLTIEFFEFSLHFYREARRLSSRVCCGLSERGASRVGFLGAGDLAEIVYLGVQEWGLDLVAVYDDDQEGGDFMQVPVFPLTDVPGETDEPLIICLYDAQKPMRVRYLPKGIAPASNMHWIFD